MKNKPIILIALLILFTISGCYTYYPIKKDEIQNIGVDNVIMVELENEKTKYLDNVHTVKLTNDQHIEFVKSDSSKTSYSLNNIKSVKVEKFDFQKTILTTLFIPIAAILVIYVFFPDAVKT